MFVNRSIAARMTLMVLLGAGCVLGAIAGYSYFAVRRMLMTELEAKARYMATAAVNHIETVERSVEEVVRGMAIGLEMNSPSTEDMYRLLSRTLRDNPDIYGAAIALNPALGGKEKIYLAPYVFRDKGKLSRKDVGAGGYRYDIWDWFNLPEKLRKPVWSEPYFDEGGGNILMVTYNVPVFRENKFWGVVTSDVSLEWLTGLMASLSVGKGGYAWLISANGTFITHPDSGLIMNDTLFSTAEINPDPAIRASARKIGQRMIRGESDFIPYTSAVTGRDGWLFFKPVSATGWSLAVMFTREELLQQVLNFNRMNLVLGAIGFVLLLVMALAIARSITNPLRALAGATRTLAEGDLDLPLPQVKGRDEVAQLAGAFEHMRGDLKKYIARLQENAAARERIESELRIARTIQMDLVPKTFPDRKEFELYGILEPAREVGGDFYDFFMPDDQSIFIFIGDASGKGVPAALFMAVARTLLRAICREERNPAVILRRLNNEMAEANESSMFITLFCALVDLKSGECRYSNGGHNPPFVLDGKGGVTRLSLTGGPAVALAPGMEFGEKAFVFQPGDKLFLYTDGLTEALNLSGDMFGEARAVEELRKLSNAGSVQSVKSMQEALRGFAAGAEQSDDVTMLAFRMLGGQSG